MKYLPQHIISFLKCPLCVIPLLVKTNDKEKDPKILSKPKIPYLILVEQFFVRAVICDSHCNGSREESLRHVSNAAVRNDSLIHQVESLCGQSIILRTAHPLYSLYIVHWHRKLVRCHQFVVDYFHQSVI